MNTSFSSLIVERLSSISLVEPKVSVPPQTVSVRLPFESVFFIDDLSSRLGVSRQQFLSSLILDVLEDIKEQSK